MNALTCLRGFVGALVVYQATRNCSVFSLLSVLLFPARDLFGRCIWFLLPEYVSLLLHDRDFLSSMSALQNAYDC